MATNVNVETGIAYGTIYGQDCPILMDEIIDNGVDETFTAHKRDCIKQMAALLEEHGQRDAEQQAEAIVDNYEWDNYDCAASESDYSYTDADGNQFLMSSLGGALLVWCVKTSVVTHARPCSPCVPGAGDLDSPDPDGIECYGIPPQYLSDRD